LAGTLRHHFSRGTISPNDGELREMGDGKHDPDMRQVTLNTRDAIGPPLLGGTIEIEHAQ